MSTSTKEVRTGSNWTATHVWEVQLGDHNTVFTPASKVIDRIVSPVSIVNMLKKSMGLEKNKAGNHTVLYKFANGQTKVVGFLSTISGSKLKEPGIHKLLKSLPENSVTTPLSTEDMEAEFNV